MKALLFSIVLSVSCSALAECKLETPIDLGSLHLDVQRELFATSTTPDLKDVMDYQDEDYPDFNRPRMLNLSYTEIRTRDFIPESPAPKVIGARVSLDDTGWDIGVSDVYLNSRLERSLTKQNGVETHIVRYASDYFCDVSTVKVKDNKVISIEIQNKKKSLCVTKAGR